MLRRNKPYTAVAESSCHVQRRRASSFSPSFSSLASSSSTSELTSQSCCRSERKRQRRRDCGGFEGFKLLNFHGFFNSDCVLSGKTDKKLSSRGSDSGNGFAETRLKLLVSISDPPGSLQSSVSVERSTENPLPAARQQQQQRWRQICRQKRQRSNRNNHNQLLQIDWANLDKKEFMKLVSSLDIGDLFEEVVNDSVKYSEGAKKWHMQEYVLQRKDRRIFVGGQGFVLFVRRRQHSSSLAMKVCLHSACRARMERYQLKANLQAAAQRESRFISDLLVHYMTARFFVSVMYKAKHSSLKVIKREIGSFPASFVRYYAACIASALHRLHRIHVCHKDIKADNVLVDHRGVPQLADFGLAVECKVSPDAFAANKRVTTMQYYPPECLVLGAKTNDYKVDSWLFGFFISEISIPSAAHMWTKFQGCTTDGWRFRLCDACQIPASFSTVNSTSSTAAAAAAAATTSNSAASISHLRRGTEALSKLLRSLLRQDPRCRPNIRDTLRCAYFSDVNWHQLETELPPDSLHVRTLLSGVEKGDD